MADIFKGLTDQYGRPIEKKALTTEVAGPTLSGVRSPMTGYPGDGLNPVRLAQILREADQGDPVRYLELAETIEERDPHYLGVLGTRKRAVSQIDVTVEPASASAEDQARADMIAEWLKRDELAGETRDILDAIGKGYSFTEIMWDSSEGQWRPAKLEWRDPRWFRFERRDLTTPVLIGEGGEDLPLPAFKFIRAVMKAKSGLPIRSGIARVATWAWMFKAFTLRDWAIFVQNFGQPIRIGKYGPGATKEDRDVLFRAVANIAGDCAAIIPNGMEIDFQQTNFAGDNSKLFGDRADWFDRQLSKLVLGQTATTDAIAGGHAVGKEHREVQEDIERSDCKDLSAILNRDLIRPWIDLEFGPQKAYPRLKIGRADEVDVELVVTSVTKLVPMGLKVGQKQMRSLVGIGAPEDGDELLTAPAAKAAAEDPRQPAGVRPQGETADDLNAEQPGRFRTADEVLGDAALGMGAGSIAALLDELRSAIDGASSPEEARAAIAAIAGQAAPADLSFALSQAAIAAELAGRLGTE
jgi:phage gp29-like protein